MDINPSFIYLVRLYVRFGALRALWALDLLRDPRGVSVRAFLAGVAVACSAIPVLLYWGQMESVSSSPILVVSASWRTRVLLAAQIAEVTGREVVSASGVDEALGLVKLGRLEPALLVVDTGEQIGCESAERLLDAKRETPAVAIVGRVRRHWFDGLRDRCDAYLLRPVTMGAIAETVAKMLDACP
jgi:hypothetical protein